jgi:capsular polysaccharide biosynthesis protein
MSDPALDLRRSVQIVRRRRALVSIVAALGLLAGAAYSVLHPPMFRSTATVVLPHSVPSSGQAANAVSPYAATQMVIVRSNPVLSAALPNIRPAVSLNGLQNEIQVSSPTPYIISISAEGKTAADAELTANEVASSYVAYANSSSSPIAHVSAGILGHATAATRKSPLESLLITGLIGALGGAFIGIIVSLAVGRKDRWLRERDEIASSIGVPVLASFPVRHPKDAAGWTAVLKGYELEARDAWRMRQALMQLGMEDAGSNNGSGSGSFSVAVMSLSSDHGALAIGPQLAAFATSLGIPTTLVIGPQQDGDAAATLRRACATAAALSSERPVNLRILVSDNGDADNGDAEIRLNDALTVAVVVVDGRAPRMPDTMRTTTTVLGVSAGKITAEQLARAAVAAAADHRDVTGILVADPEATDRTTGRIVPLARPRHRRLPNRLNGLITEVRR